MQVKTGFEQGSMRQFTANLRQIIPIKMKLYQMLSPFKVAKKEVLRGVERCGVLNSQCFLLMHSMIITLFTHFIK